MTPRQRRRARINGMALAESNKTAADAHALQIAAAVRSLQVEAKTIRALMAAMNSEGIPTPLGRSWHLPSTHNLLKRLDRLGV